jgi:hypothetical protein
VRVRRVPALDGILRKRGAAERHAVRWRDPLQDLMTIEVAREIAAIVASGVTAVAVVVAGLWTYWLFVRQRLRFPRVEITVSVQDEPLSQSQRLVQVTVALRNTGSVLLRSRSAELRLRQVVPVPDALRDSVLSGFDPVPPGKTEVEWPMLVGREWPWAIGQFEIEPGEVDVLTADFVIDSSIEVVQLYFFLSNPSKGRAGLGWTDTRLYRLPVRKGM